MICPEFLARRCSGAAAGGDAWRAIRDDRTADLLTGAAWRCRRRATTSAARDEAGPMEGRASLTIVRDDTVRAMNCVLRLLGFLEVRWRATEGLT